MNQTPIIMKNVLKSWLLPILLLLFAAVDMNAQQTICFGETKNYNVDGAAGTGTAGSTYDWTVLEAGFAGTITGNPTPATLDGNGITIDWGTTPAGDYTLQVIETNNSCPGEAVTLTITINPENTIALSSVVNSDDQTLCIDTAITNITYDTTGATGADFAGLPNGVTGAWAGDVVTISGTPDESGTFNYTVTLTGGCGTIEATGTIEVTPNNTIALSSAVNSDDQTLCIDNAITDITYDTNGASGASITGLPNGVTGAWVGDVVTISGTPDESGTFNYTVTLTGGCGTIEATGTIEVTPNNTIALSSAVNSDDQTLCIDTAITNITYDTTGATGADFAGLPNGVTGSWVGDVVTISGTPDESGTFNYTVTLTGGCGTIQATGTIEVTPNNTIALSSAVNSDDQTLCIDNAITDITYDTTGATGASITGLPNGVTGAWAGDVVTISGTPDESGTFNYTVTLTGGCGTIEATGTIEINPTPTTSAISFD